MKKIFTCILIAVCLPTMAGCANNNTASTGLEANSAANTQTLQTTSATDSESEAGSTETSVSTDAANATIGTTTESSTVIGEDKAKAVALEHAGLSENEVTFILAYLDHDDGRNVYDVEFYVDLQEYDYEIDAYSGEILSYDFDIESYEGAARSSGETTTARQSNGAAITLEEAKAIALEKAGVSESDATFTETSFEYDDSIAVYQIGFISGTMEYEIEVNANTGAITEYDVEAIYD